ncbi:MAG: TetR family transcriptional regulator [Gammaproteobacteria bacterium]|nr:TetR family transcriptional regulator [Gammaproteobacteria bacterium]MBU1439770.1 TetR family transcriptional regulator [Gammaproteobacteria bacterium]MBU2408637.1 TetR family transcriptional regulator [Gammaproteobacteria bacterium]
MSRTSAPPPTAPDRAEDTRTHLLDVAEELFAQHGFNATSTRMVATIAKINLGSLHYYFNSKEALYLEVFRRRGVPLVAERLRRLEAAQARAGSSPVPVRELLRCFVEPFLETSMRRVPPAFTQLHCRLQSEPVDLAMLVRASIYNESTRTFVQAFARTLAHLPDEVLYWRLHFMIGAYTYTLMNSGRLEFISEGQCKSTDLDAAFSQILPFLEAGLTAPLN